VTRGGERDGGGFGGSCKKRGKNVGKTLGEDPQNNKKPLNETRVTWWGKTSGHGEGNSENRGGSIFSSLSGTAELGKEA